MNPLSPKPSTLLPLLFAFLFFLLGSTLLQANGTPNYPNVLWHHSSTGAINYMPIDNMIPQDILNVAVSSNTNLLPKGIGDFTGDGKPDILFHNQNSGMVLLWEMNGTTKVQNINILASSNTNLQVAGVGDFDRDGDNDIAVFNTNSGTLLIWVMQGATRVDNIYVLSGNKNLVAKGVGDMDNDGIPDIILRNNNSGAVRVWTMNDDFSRKSNEYVTGSSNTNLQLRGVVDINKDGNQDILNYNTNTGVLRAWLMDGSLGITENAEIIQEADLEWSVRGGYLALAYWKQVSAGEYHTVAIKSDGTLWAWGRNYSGQLGDGTTEDKLVPTQESTAATDWNVTSAGGSHTTAIKSDGTLWAWGRNIYGQLGDGTTTWRSVPTQEDTNATNWSSVSAGGAHTTAIRSDGTLWEWGDNWHEDMEEDGETTNRLIPAQEPTLSTDWSSVSAGDSYDITAIKSDGTLWAWGDNYDGQLGDGTTTWRSVPTQEITEKSDWISVNLGWRLTTAIKTDGTLWAWGNNYIGQLGDGTIVNKPVPTQEINGATDWTSISAGDIHSTAIKSDGTLWAWGSNNRGRLGDGTMTSRPVPTREDTNATNWSSVSAGGAHSTAIKSDGTLWAWGNNDSGQLGDGTTEDKWVPTHTAREN